MVSQKDLKLQRGLMGQRNKMIRKRFDLEVQGTSEITQSFMVRKISNKYNILRFFRWLVIFAKRAGNFLFW